MTVPRPLKDEDDTTHPRPTDVSLIAYWAISIMYFSEENGEEK